MRVLVADDEQIMLDSIRYMLQGVSDFTLESASNGREAIELAETFHPNVVMMDIKMPGINGLEALTEIRRLDPHATLIVLSAYDNFNYAQEAIHLSVFDYLIKPVTKKRLLETLDRAKRKLKEARDSRRKELILREKYKKLVPMIENDFLQSLFMGIDEASLEEFQELLGVSFRAGFFLAVSPCLQKSHQVLTNEIREGIRYLFPCCLGQDRTKSIQIFIPLTSTEEHKPTSFYAEQILAYFRTQVKEDIRIGVGRVYPVTVDISRSYYEALQSLGQTDVNKPISFYQKSEKEDDQWQNALDDTLEELIEGVRFGQLNKVQSSLQNAWKNLIAIVGNDDVLIRYYLLELTLQVNKVARKNLIDFNGTLFGYRQIGALFNLELSVDSLFSSLTKEILAATELIKANQDNNVNGAIRKAKELIDQNYQEQLTLEHLACAVNISPYYLSRQFREELGISFIEYLTNIRMEKAQKLLSQGLSVKECCFSVGYNDPNYFSRLFRKFHRMTPTEFRDTYNSMRR